MTCRFCNVHMRKGTHYEKKVGQLETAARRFDECPKCHRRKYNNGENTQQAKPMGFNSFDGMVVDKRYGDTRCYHGERHKGVLQGKGRGIFRGKWSENI